MRSIEAGQFLAREIAEPCPGLLARGILRQPSARPEIGMSAQQCQLRLTGGSLDGIGERLDHRLAGRKRPEGRGVARNPGRVLGHVAKSGNEVAGAQGIDLSDRLLHRGPLPILRQPGAQGAPLFVGHAGFVAERHGVGVHGLLLDERGKAPEVVDGFEDRALGSFGEAFMGRLLRMAQATQCLRVRARTSSSPTLGRAERSSIRGAVMTTATASAPKMKGSVQAMSRNGSPTSWRTRKCRRAAPPMTINPTSSQAWG